jgi:hypothetical protein
MAGISSVFSQTLPDGLTVKKDFAPGIGLSLGKIVLIQGKAVVIHHHDRQVGYEVRQDMFLYQKDKIITLNNGRVSFQLNDGSQMSMSSNATMTINKSVYDPVKGDRKVFMNMPMGKSRFTVRKLKNFRSSAVKIKTSTAIIGVRGSDFIVMASEQTTEIVTLDDTQLELNSLFDPSAQAVLIQAYERSEVKSQALPSQPEPVLPEEIESIMADFSFAVETASHINTPESKNISDKTSSKQKTSDKQPVKTSQSGSKNNVSEPGGKSKADETRVTETKNTGDMKPGANQTVARTSFAPVLISEKIIEEPKPFDMGRPNFMEPQIDIVPVPPIHDNPYQTIQDLHVDIIEEHTEDKFKSKLPSLPARPE